MSDIQNFMPDFNLADLKFKADEPVTSEENVLSFRKPIVNAEVEKERPANAPKRITRSQIIDKFTTKRTRVHLSPSVCTVCAFDVAAAKHGGWEGVPDRHKADVLEALALHKQEFHPVKEDLIIYEDEMPTEWLGTGKTL